MLAPGYSDEWVTAFVGSALATVVDEGAQTAARDAWLLLAKTARPGWGYNSWTPLDADSTCWGLQLAQQVGAGNSAPALAAADFLRKHRQRDGGVATYLSTSGIRGFTGASEDADYGGWLQSHVCVTAAATVIGNAALLDYLRRQQRQDGSWDAYWWAAPEYSTALALQALSNSQSPADRACTHRSLTWVNRRVRNIFARGSAEDDQVFAIAWLTRALSLDSSSAQSRVSLPNAIKLLTARQLAGGAWAAAARLRVPNPDIRDPRHQQHWVEGGRIQGAIVRDQRGIFTTATAVAALAFALKAS